MGFKMGALVGFGVGYYLGAKAGRERYHQINDWLQQARDAGPAQAVQDAARDLRGGDDLSSTARNN
jgi:hypothetical protein